MDIHFLWRNGSRTVRKPKFRDAALRFSNFRDDRVGGDAPSPTLSSRNRIFSKNLLLVFGKKIQVSGIHFSAGLALAFLLLFPTSLNAAYDDARVKAAFIYRLLYFIEHPSLPANTINICVVGDNPFTHVAGELEERTFGNRRIKLVQKKRSDNLSSCQAVYISASASAYFQDILRPLRAKPILTISDINQFAKYGGMVGFTEYNNTLRMDINTQSLAVADFQIDPHLLEVAFHVYP